MDASEPDGSSDTRHNLMAALVVGIMVLVLAGVGVGAWLWLRDATGVPVGASTSAEPQEGPAASPTPDTPSSPGPPSSPSSPAPSPAPSGTATPEPPPGGRLAFTPLAGQWRTNDPVAGLLPDGFAQSAVTERNYSGENDWLAVVMSGKVPRGTRGADPADTAAKVSAWFTARGFDGSGVRAEVLADRPTQVDGRPAHLLKARFDYQVRGLKADADVVTIVVVDLGPKLAPGLYLSSVPKTHSQLAKDVEKARASLHVVR